MKKILVITVLTLLSTEIFPQIKNSNVHIGILGEGLGPTIMIETDLKSEDGVSLYLRGGISWLFYGYGIPHGLSICKGDKHQIEFGVSGFYSSTEEFLGDRIAKEYHVSPIVGYRGYSKRRKAFYRLYINPMINSSQQPISYGLFNGDRFAFMGGLSIGFKL